MKTTLTQFFYLNLHKTLPTGTLLPQLSPDKSDEQPINKLPLTIRFDLITQALNSVYAHNKHFVNELKYFFNEDETSATEYAKQYFLLTSWDKTEVNRATILLASYLPQKTITLLNAQLNIAFTADLPEYSTLQALKIAYILNKNNLLEDTVLYNIIGGGHHVDTPHEKYFTAQFEKLVARLV